MLAQYVKKRAITACLCCLLFMSVRLQAQTCGNNYAEPAWTANFNFPDGLPERRTAYTVSKDSCPQPGFYSVTTRLPDCFGVSYPNDPPTDDFLFFNSAASPSAVYTDTVYNLCTSSVNMRLVVDMSYAAAASACGGQPSIPYFAFTLTALSGQTLVTYNTGKLFDAGVIQYDAFFTNVPGNTAAVIRIDNLSKEACGNSFILNDIKVVACGPAASVQFASMAGNFMTVCATNKATIQLNGTVDNGYKTPAYQWQNFDGTNWVDVSGATALTYPLQHPSAAGLYQYRLTASEADNIANEGCRVATDVLKVAVTNPENVTATSNSPVCENSLLTLTAQGGSSFSWTGPNGFISNQQNLGFAAHSTSAGEYTVISSVGIGCTDTATTTVSLLPLPSVTVSNTQAICAGDEVNLLAGGGIQYSWSPGSYLSNPSVNNPVANPPVTTLYSVTVEGSNHCTDTASIKVIVQTKPVVNAGKDTTIIKGNPVLLHGFVGDSTGLFINWQPATSLNNPNILAPIANPEETTTYVLTATSDAGCGVGEDSVVVTVFKNLNIPAAFSPNGDGLNDVWHIPALLAFPKAKLAVYNRFGEKIFESTGSNKGWDGTCKSFLLPTGSYPFMIDLKNNTPVIKGTVTLVR